MRKDPDIDRRLLNWARWRWGVNGGGRIGGWSTEHRVDGEGWDAVTVIPTNDAEAEVTDVGVAALVEPYRGAVEAYYLCIGGVADRARLAGCSETALRDRVGMAHRHLAQWLADRAAAAQAQRERMEALQRARGGR